MRLDKKIKELPWPEFEGVGKQDVMVTGAWLISNHERLLVLTFIKRPATWRIQGEQHAVRVIISKKQQDFAVLFKGESNQRKIILEKALPHLYIYSCYPNIEKRVEDMIYSITGSKCNNHQMGALNWWMQNVIENRNKARRIASGAFEDEDVRLCPDELPEGLAAWICGEILPNDKTIIYKKGGVRGTCAVCGRSFRNIYANKMRQYEYATCPNCGIKCTAILENSAAWKADYVENVMAIQKGKDGTVWFRQWHILRDNSAQYEKGVENHLQEIARYAVRGRKAAMWLTEKKYCYCGANETYRLENWERIRSIYTYEGYAFFSGGMIEAVQGSILQYANLRGYLNTNGRSIMKYAVNFARYPVMEFLWKAGYRNLVEEKVSGLSKQNSNDILWKRDKLTECFRFPIRMLKHKKPEEWTMSDIGLMRALCERKNLTEKEIVVLFKSNVALELIDSISKYASAIKTINYLKKQQQGSDALGLSSAIARTYRDYIGECEKLELDLTQRDVLFPRDLTAAHDRTMQMIKFEQSKAIQERFDKQLEKLNKLSWKSGGLIIRPAGSQEELVKEGKVLNHCVGGYAERMANGETAIFLIREASSPDKPFYTLELQDKRIVQCRGKGNKPYDGDIKHFANEWLSKIVKKEKLKQKSA